MEFRKLRGMESRPPVDTVRSSLTAQLLPPLPSLLTLLLSHRLSYSPLETSRVAVLGQGPLGWEWGRDVRGDHPRLMPVPSQEEPIRVP